MIDEVYSLITLPTKQEIMNRAKILVYKGYETPKGKKLKFKPHRSRVEVLKDKTVRLVEDDIQLFESLTSEGLMIPREGGERSGGRVFDSFTLMPKWIREMIKIEDQTLIEIDYASLHPNLAKTIYDHTNEHISHDDIITFYKSQHDKSLSRKIVKQQHLKFFNLPQGRMRCNALYEYYVHNHQTLINKVLKVKDQFGYKKVSMELFEAEVKLMTRVISKLKREGIKAIYVYDALMVPAEQVALVKRIMNETALELSVNTYVK